jgi:hypothetical protein
MSGVLGYSSAEPSSINDLTLMPRGVEWSSDLFGNAVMEEKIRNITTGGKRYDNIKFDRIVFSLNFHYPQSENEAIRDLYYACRADAIWIVPDSEDIATKYNVRLEQSGFSPSNTGQPGQLTDTMEPWFRVTMVLSTETVEVEIED